MDDFVSPTVAAKWLARELDWVESSTRSNIYDGRLLEEPWSLVTAQQSGGSVLPDWRISSDSIESLIERYRSKEWAEQHYARRKTSEEKLAKVRGVEAQRVLDPLSAMQKVQLQISTEESDLPATAATGDERYAEALRVVGEALIQLSDAVRGGRQ